MTTRSPPVTRKKTAALRVYEDYPASPSEPNVPPTGTVTESTRLESAIQTERTTAVEAVTRATRAPTICSHRSTASAAARIKQAELEAEEQLMELRRQEIRMQAEFIKKKLALDVATIREDTDHESVHNERETERRVQNWLRHSHPRGEQSEPGVEPRNNEQSTRPREKSEERTQANQVTFDQTPVRQREGKIERLADALEKMARYRAPPRQTQELPIFSGDPREWLAFKAAMRDSTNLLNLSPAENLARLRACLRGEARQAVSALLYATSSPHTIMQTLEQCYGRPEMIIDQALEEIKKLPRIGTTASELNAFAIKLQNAVTTITCIDERGYLMNPMLVRSVTEKLSPHVKARWCDYAEEYGNRSEAEIITLSKFLMREADRAMRHAFTNMPTTRAVPTTTTTQSRPNEARTSRKPVYATTEDTRNEKNERRCLCCGASHKTTECGKLKEMTVPKRWDWAKETRICFRCLNSKHRRIFCKGKRCGINECRQPHHALLHTIERSDVQKEQEASIESVTTAAAHTTEDQMQVLLKVCPITIQGNNGKELQTYALLDEGSTITLIDEDIATEIGTRGPTRTLNIVGATTSQQEPNSRVVRIRIRGQDQRPHLITARTVKNLTLGRQSVSADLSQYPYLRELQSNVCYTNAKPRLLIGADNWHLIVTRKLLTGKKKQPAASLTQLGWILHGSMPSSVISNEETVLHVRTQQPPTFKAAYKSEVNGLLTKRYAEEVKSDSRNDQRHWIKNDQVKYTPYVAHRLSEIADLTRPEQWRWVPTEHNAADDATRSGNVQLSSQSRWLTGPPFLYENEERWPLEKVPTLDRSPLEAIVLHIKERSPLIDATRFSSYERLVRALAHALLFIDKCRMRANKLTVKHLQEAKRLLIREAQRDSFPTEIEQMNKGRNVDRKSRLYNLDPIYGEDKVLRLNSRINAANVPKEHRNPPILDGSHYVARLMITREHEMNHHAGREQLVNNLRQRYWILRLRPTVRNIVKKCVICKTRRAAPTVPIKGNLPAARLHSHTRPFTNCGIDCYGPMFVTIGRRREKRWGMLFTCLVTRAIHIELIASLSTDSAIMALRRMAARRGMPKLIITDNATNFHGADVELTNAYKEWLPALENYALTKRIEWRYIDPGAPNQGGAWERMIKTVKTALLTTLNDRAPKEEILQTLTAEIEHTVNSRPLTHVPVNPEDQEALTPNHFLLGTSTGLPYVGECSVADKRTWRAAQALANSFWARWIKEYLPTLAPRGDNHRATHNVKPGDLVIIADGLLPRNVWPRGVVEKVYTGPDGVVRSAEVRTKEGVFRRPTRRLVVLPLEEGSEDLRRGETVTDNENPAL